MISTRSKRQAARLHKSYLRKERARWKNRVKNSRKSCAKCGEKKHLDQFYKNKKSFDGRTSYCKACSRACQEISCKKDSSYRHAAQIKTKYNLSRKEYDDLLKGQRGRCAICRQPFDRTPNVDHNHRTGKVRGLLCKSCNMGLGNFLDKIPLLTAAISYLRKR